MFDTVRYGGVGCGWMARWCRWYTLLINKQNFGHELESCGGKPALVLTVQIEEKRNLIHNTRWLLISCCLVHFAPGSTNSQDPGHWKSPLVGVTVTALLLFFLLVVFLLIRLVKFWLGLKFWRKKSRVLSFSSVQTCSFFTNQQKDDDLPKTLWGRRCVGQCGRGKFDTSPSRC